MTVKRRMGLMGGTFNPIHMGHLIIAEEARERFALEKVIFIPSYITPNKEVKAAPAEERLRMVELAVESNPYFSVSDMEIRQKGMSYTVSTLRALKERYGDDWELYFISGTDAVASLPLWYQPEQILSLCRFIGAVRPGGIQKAEEVVASFKKRGKNIELLPVPAIDISSTDIRNRIRNGKSVRYMVPEKVYTYIKEKRLYSE